MSENTFLEVLLDGAEVELMPLGEVVKTVTAAVKVRKKEYNSQGDIPIIDQGAEFIAGYADEICKAAPLDEYGLCHEYQPTCLQLRRPPLSASPGDGRVRECWRPRELPAALPLPFPNGEVDAGSGQGSFF